MPIDILWGLEADRTKVSQYSLDVLAELLTRSGNRSCMIGSTVRTPEADVRVVFDNLEQPEGVAKALALYKAPMHEVISVYMTEKADGQPPDVIRGRMLAKMMEVGPRLCSHHILTDEELKRLNVIDVRPSTLVNAGRFEAECRLEAPYDAVHNPTGKRDGTGLLVKFLTPPNDPAFHLEIAQPTA